MVPFDKLRAGSAHHQDLTPILTSIFRRKKRIAAVYFFGSTATGRDHRGSDLDLAIVAKKTISGRERLRIEADLSSRLRRDVDLVVFGIFRKRLDDFDLFVGLITDWVTNQELSPPAKR